MEENHNLPKLIAVVGTNASGKSAMGIELAKLFDGEIVSADSRQIYRGFDLCCGKVTPEETRQVPHHLLDIRDMGEEFSVYDFQQEAYAAIDQILLRGRVPFLVGGTGLYVSAVVHGYELRPGVGRTDLREWLEGLSLEELRSMLPDKARLILEANPSEMRNKRRVIRAIEKCAQGEPLSHSNTPRYKVLQLGVTWPKEVLDRRIEERLDARLAQGMIGEVDDYLAWGGDGKVLYSLGLEYRYIYLYLRGKYAGEEEFKAELSRAIKRFAKRQMTWFRRDGAIHWLDMGGDCLSQARRLVEEFLRDRA